MTALGLAADQQAARIIELERQLRNAEDDYRRLSVAVKAVLMGTPTNTPSSHSRALDGLYNLVQNTRKDIELRSQLSGYACELQGALNGHELGQYPSEWR